ncbi:MAG: pentapeptide repeat-containing protein [Rhodobacteraceae bacterium]|nr:pentapeptide repeat-containing protein [Paracoccaceae bacterium]
MEGADLSKARLEGADLWRASLQSVKWAGATIGYALVHSTDLRDARGLRQAMLENVIGNADTKLPDISSPDEGETYFVWSCWEAVPKNYETIVKAAYGDLSSARYEANDLFLCQHRSRIKTGTPTPLDAK